MDTNSKYKVYIHTTPSDKKYVGITKLSIISRLGGAKGTNYRQCPAFYNAIQKYGLEAIKTEVIKDNLNKEDAEKMECQLIAKYNTTDSKYGYNISKGGGAFGGHSETTKSKISRSLTGNKNPFFGKQHSPEIMETIRSKNLGKKRTTEWKNKRSIQYSGEGNPNFGKKPSANTKEIWRNQREGRKLSIEWRKNISKSSKSSKAVECIETGEIFKSCCEAARIKGIKTPRNIGDVCRGKGKTCGGFRWRFIDCKIEEE